MAIADVHMARQQMILETRQNTTLTEHGEQIAEFGERLDQPESAIEGEHVTKA